MCFIEAVVTEIGLFLLARAGQAQGKQSLSFAALLSRARGLERNLGRDSRPPPAHHTLSSISTIWVLRCWIGAKFSLAEPIFRHALARADAGARSHAGADHHHTLTTKETLYILRVLLKVMEKEKEKEK